MTRIYCAGSAECLLVNTTGNVVEFPELTNVWDTKVPLHPKEIIAKCPDLAGLAIITLSEHIVLWFVKQVRIGKMQPDEVEVYWVGAKGECRRLRLDDTGEFIDHWPEGFFDERGDLLFND